MSENLLALPLRLAALGCLSSALSLAGTWSGTLVDSRCWDTEETNVRDTSIFVDRDGNLELSICRPTTKTKSFAFVKQDGLNFKLNSAGNAKAIELVRQPGKRSRFNVDLTGEMNNNTIRVDSISMAR
jgi:hypothetical protein